MILIFTTRPQLKAVNIEQVCLLKFGFLAGQFCL